MNAASEHDRGLTRGICEMTLETRDPASLASFFRTVFDWPELSREDGRVWLACGGRARLGLWSPGAKEFDDEGGRHVHFALSVSRGRLDELVRRLEELGIEHRGPVEHKGGDRSVYFEDPEGNVVETWDFFEQGDGAREGVDALASGDGAAA